MLYAVLGLVALVVLGFALYAIINRGELVAQVSALQRELEHRESEHAAELEARVSALQNELKTRDVAHSAELASRTNALQSELERWEARYNSDVGKLKAELSRFDRIKHVPDILEKAEKIEALVAAKLEQAQREGDEIVLVAHKDAERMKLRIAQKLEESELKASGIIATAAQEADRMRRSGRTDLEEARQTASETIQMANREAESIKQRLIREASDDAVKAKEARRVAEWQAKNVVEEALSQAKQIASQARKEAKEKTKKVDEALKRATDYAREIRERAEQRAKEIAGVAYDALKQYEFYESTAKAMQNVIDGYQGMYLVPSTHMLDELAEEYGFDEAGERLKLARERTKLMEKDGLAATCNFPEGWKRDYAINFVLSAFNGKVDSILSRLKAANHGRMVQEIKDAYALTNHNGQVFKNAKIREEFLEARLDELKWAVAVQRLKEKEREEQRAIREQIREEEKARKEYERAIKQAEREEEVLSKALEKARQEFDAASAEDRAKYEGRLQELQAQLQEAEEKNRRALSMAQQTKCGHVYVISNIGSFGEDVFKIGLTRRLEPLDRVRELGDASVPFPFDVHALIRSEDAPALEAELHRRFVQNQVNKVNRRKEFFRVKLQDIRSVVEELNCEVKWTLAAEAQQYRETLALERRLQQDPEFQKRWTEAEAAYQPLLPFEEESEEAVEMEEGAAFAENA